MALDGLHLVLSRLALLDIFLAFFLLLGAHCVVADRQWLRDRLAAGSRRTWLRPWLLAGGVAFGLAVGTKWSGAYALAAFGLLAWVWSAGARRAFGQRRPWLRSVVLDGLPAFAQLVLVAFVVYVASWTGWLVNAHEYEQALSNTQYTAHASGEQWPTDAVAALAVALPPRRLRLPQPLPRRQLPHLRLQPVGLAADGAAGRRRRPARHRAGNWRHGVAVVGVAATWLPWFLYDDRPIFVFYAIASLPFMVLSLALAVGALLGPATPGPRRTAGVVVAGSWFVMTVLAFAWFWPVWTDQLITHEEWTRRIWFTRWI
jgi:dolichyl-phosphate-mannose--protein O-mannosyl transferase